MPPGGKFDSGHGAGAPRLRSTVGMPAGQPRSGPSRGRADAELAAASAASATAQAISNRTGALVILPPPGRRPPTLEGRRPSHIVKVRQPAPGELSATRRPVRRRRGLSTASSSSAVEVTPTRRRSAASRRSTDRRERNRACAACSRVRPVASSSSRRRCSGSSSRVASGASGPASRSTAWTRERAPTLHIAERTCDSTVAREIASRAAISRLETPAETSIRDLPLAYRDLPLRHGRSLRGDANAAPIRRQDPSGSSTADPIGGSAPI